jgi:hypothetical protein
MTELNGELERIWKDVIIAYTRYHPGICLEVLRKSIKTSVRTASDPTETR